MILKPGVKLTELSPQMALAAQVVEGCYRERLIPCVITSGNDSTHSPNSLHYAGLALDFRTKNVSNRKKELAGQIQAALGANFDVLLEDEGGPNEHLHVEYDPE